MKSFNNGDKDITAPMRESRLPLLAPQTPANIDHNSL